MDSFIFYTAPDIQQTLADKIQKVRKLKGWTQKEMAQRSDIPLSTYARFEQLGEGSMKDFAKIIVTLGRGDEIEKILNSTTKGETPMDIYNKVKSERQK